MALWVKAPVSRPGNLRTIPQDPHDEMRELTPTIFPLTPTGAPWHVHACISTHTHTHTHEVKPILDH